MPPTHRFSRNKSHRANPLAPASNSVMMPRADLENMRSGMQMLTTRLEDLEATLVDEFEKQAETYQRNEELTARMEELEGRVAVLEKEAADNAPIVEQHQLNMYMNENAPKHFTT
jgi:uncharacterized coiled-coil protein SlyX